MNWVLKDEEKTDKLTEIGVCVIGKVEMMGLTTRVKVPDCEMSSMLRQLQDIESYGNVRGTE